MNCQTDALGLCLYHDTSLNSLFVYAVHSNLSLDSLVMKITAKVVFSSIDTQNKLTMGTIPIYQTFTLTVKSCSETQL